MTQQNHLFPHLTALRNIAYGLRDRSGAMAQQRVAELIDRLRLNGLEERRVWQLSGGQQQRTALARALAPSPEPAAAGRTFRPRWTWNCAGSWARNCARRCGSWTCR